MMAWLENKPTLGRSQGKMADLHPNLACTKNSSVYLTWSWKKYGSTTHYEKNVKRSLKKIGDCHKKYNPNWISLGLERRPVSRIDPNGGRSTNGGHRCGTPPEPCLTAGRTRDQVRFRVRFTVRAKGGAMQGGGQYFFCTNLDIKGKISGSKRGGESAFPQNLK